MDVFTSVVDFISSVLGNLAFKNVQKDEYSHSKKNDNNNAHNN